jgi:hypothetical protein
MNIKGRQGVRVVQIVSAKGGEDKKARYGGNRT